MVVGLAVPAYLVPYALCRRNSPPVGRVGRCPVVFGSLTLFVVSTAATMSASSGTAFVWWQAATGVGASGVAPISLTLIGDLVAFERRGRALGWLFGAMAGGIAVGSTGSTLAEPVVGWRGLFAAMAVLATALGAVAMSTRAVTSGFTDCSSRRSLVLILRSGKRHLWSR
jgi:MFS family permease